MTFNYRSFSIVALILTACLLSACGQKGALVLTEQPTTTKPSAPTDNQPETTEGDH